MSEAINGGAAELVKEIKAASDAIAAGEMLTKQKFEEFQKSMVVSDGRFGKIDESLKAFETKQATFETGLNDLFKRTGRPGAELMQVETDIHDRKEALSFLEARHEERIKKRDSEHPFQPTEDEIKAAIAYRRGLHLAIHTIDHNTLPVEVRKSLSAFALGSNGFILAPEMSNRVISCIIDPSDLGGLFSSMTTTAPSVKFLIDNARTAVGGWACESTCFANNPQPDLTQGLGELEIKPETLRYIACVTRDLLEDASINIENWLMGKVSNGIRAVINNAFVVGDGVGKPIGILNPNAGIPILDTSAATPGGQFTWQDLLMMKYDLPVQWHAGCTWLMNQRTFALLHTMSDGINRPIWSQFPGGDAGYTVIGSPIQVVTQMPDCLPGNCPIAYGNWKEVYMIVWRKAITMQQDPYTAGFCVLFKFDARVGGGILCPNAARLLRIHP